LGCIRTRRGEGPCQKNPAALPKDHRDGDRRNYTPHQTHRYYRVHIETYPRLNHLGDR
jgi:hypothetical protein